MAEQPIKHTDIIEPGNPFDVVIKGAEELLKIINKLQEELVQTAKGWKEFQAKQNTATKQGREGTKKVAAEINNLTQKSKELLKSETKLKQMRSDAFLQTRKNALAMQRLRKETDNLIRSQEAEKGSLLRNRIALNKWIERAGKAAPAAAKKMEQRIQKLTKTVSDQEKAMGRHQRNVGNYPKIFDKAKDAVKTFATGVVGATVLIAGMSRAIKNSIGIILNFDQAMADVGAITRATDEEMQMFRENAKELGRTTRFTASEVAKLQKELGKLGFTTQEILKSTESILGLAAAVDEDLGRAAEVAGATVRAFGLTAEETARVVDVMARSFTGSALDLERFSTAMRTVAPVANAFNFSVEETTALLGALVNAGFDASMAGTALRNILLNLADVNGALAQELGGNVGSFEELIPAMIQLRDRGVSLNETLELTDKRSVAAFNRFLEAAEFTREFATELNNAAGAAQEMSEKQLDTLLGDLKILKSAYEGLILATGDSNESMKTMAREGIQATTEGIGLFNKGMNAIPEFAKNAVKGLIPGFNLFKNLGVVINATTDEVEDYVDAVSGADGMTESQEEFNQVISKTIEQVKKEREEFIKMNQIREDTLKLFDMTIEKAEETRDVIDFDIVDSLLPDETEEEQRADNILRIDQRVTADSIALSEKEKQEKMQNEQASAAFSQQMFQRGLAGLDQFAQERGIILNASLLADQTRAIAATIIALGVGSANTAKVGFPQNIPLLIGFAGQVAGLLSTLKSIKVGAGKFEHGGSGELGSEGKVLSGERHTSGGVNLGEIGEAERGEYFGIINRPMTKRYHDDLPHVFETLNKGTFHNVWSRSNDRLQGRIKETRQDPYTKMTYHLLSKQPMAYNDSEGNQVLLYPTGKKRVIKNVRV